MRAAGIFTSTGNNVTMEFAEPDQLTVTSASGDLGESRVDVPAAVKGAGVKVILNHRYVLDCLSAIGAKGVSFKMTGDSAPVLVSSPEVAGYTYVVMPIKI
jgi:DNA polymerase-3 subunit beta